MSFRSLGAALAAPALTTLFLAAPTGAQVLEPGFDESPLGYAPALFGTSATLANGQSIAFDGQAIERYSLNGALLETYDVLPSATFASFVALAPDESFAIVGESSNGELFRVDLGSGTVTSLAIVPFNYDAVVTPGGDVIVSATASVAGANDLVVVDVSTGAQTTPVQVPGFSGPVARRANGEVLLAVTDGLDRIVSFTPAQLASPTLLGEADGTLVSSDWTGIGWMAVDRETDALFVADSDFVNFVEPSGLWLAGDTKATSKLVHTAAPGESYGRLEIVTSSATPETLHPFQPSTGGVLRYQLTDFFSFVSRVEIVPRRPSASFSGPGVSGPGFVTYTVEDAVPNGQFTVVFGGNVVSSEVPFFLGEDMPPLFWSLAPPSRVLPFLFPTDATGHGEFTFLNPDGGLAGLAMQSTIGYPTGEVIVGSAPFAQL